MSSSKWLSIYPSTRVKAKCDTQKRSTSVCSTLERLKLTGFQSNVEWQTQTLELCHQVRSPLQKATAMITSIQRLSERHKPIKLKTNQNIQIVWLVENYNLRSSLKFPLHSILRNPLARASPRAPVFSLTSESH